MHRSRSLLLVRNGVFAVAALAYSGVFLLATPLILLPVRATWPVATLYLRGLLFLLRVICGQRYVVHGIERLEPGPVLIASVHQSAWESLFFPIILGDPAVVVKDEVFGYPLLGAIARKKRYIPASRSGDLEKIRQAIGDARTQARGGRSVLIYPSGTRTGTDLHPPMRRGVAALYEKLGLPCVPIAHNSGLCWQHKSWLRHPGTIVIDILEPIPPGLGKKTFLAMLSARLDTAAARLLYRPENPVLMPNLSATARRMSEAMHAQRRAETG